jgi:chorismate mutase
MKTDNTLESLRNEIDALDDVLLTLLAKRMNIVRKIKTIKTQKGLPPLDQSRWEHVISSIVSKAKVLELDTNWIVRIWNMIHQHALKIESEVIK